MGLSDALTAVDNAANEAAKIEALRDLNELLVQKINEDESNLNQVRFFKIHEKKLNFEAKVATFGQKYRCDLIIRGFDFFDRYFSV